MYGGLGNDILNADNNLETDNGLNDVPDTGIYDIPDTAYGGGGEDTLIAGSGSDRLVDWVGEFNAYITPFAPFGQATVSRSAEPKVPEFFYAISKSDGADQTRVGPTLGTPARNGEPFGELGLVLQSDKTPPLDYHSQTGGPTDPQAGNTPGVQKEVSGSAGSASVFTGTAQTAGWSDALGAPTVLGVYVDNSDGSLTADESARIQDAITQLDSLWDGSQGLSPCCLIRLRRAANRTTGLLTCKLPGRWMYLSSRVGAGTPVRDQPFRPVCTTTRPWSRMSSLTRSASTTTREITAPSMTTATRRCIRPWTPASIGVSFRATI
jgi:hypothetical protein